MILQALVQYYEDLLANGKITRPGWTSAKVSWALELDENGQLMALHPLQQEEKRGKKTVLAPCQLQVPEQVKRSSGVAANFLCDNSAYMLGIDGKGKPERAMQCFAAAKELHLAILQNVPGQAAQAVRNFFINWDPKAAEQYQAFRRTTLKMRGELEQSQLGAELAAQEQVLCIVNRRKTAQELYNNLPKEGSYCLTTLLYPAHRKQLLQEIRERLKDGLPCRVISTSLIEAGVDVDFPAVYREEAGLDSILQAAGRCNREGRRPAEQSLVQIFTLEGQHVPRMLEQNVSATQSVLKKYADLASLEAIETYFLFYRTLKGDKRLDEQQILQGFEQDMEGRIFPFATAAERFRLIETPAVTVYIPQGKGEHLLARLRAGEVSKTLFRQLGQYGVPVYPDHLKTLENAGAVCQISEGIWELADGSLYDNNMGLAMEAETGAAWFA